MSLLMKVFYYLHFLHLCTFCFEDDWSEQDHGAGEENPRRVTGEFVDSDDTFAGQVDE
jgi:hypothetical protein